MQREYILIYFFFFQAEDGIRDYKVTGVQTCALPISGKRSSLCGSRGSPNRTGWWWSSRTNRKRSRRLRSEEHTSELQSPCNIVCRLLLEKKTPSPTASCRSSRPPSYGP